jgi:tripartite-type tricarboxylate transporter receptor subunit TctC
MNLKYLLLLLAAIPTILSANELNNVWLPFVGGNLDAICRKLWYEYDNTFQEKSIIVVKQGADTTLATKDMLAATPGKNFMCAPATTFIYNRFTYQETDVNKTEAIIQIVRFPNVWYVPNNIKAQTFKELITELRSLRRSVTIGVFTGPGNAIARYLEKQHNLSVNLVQFKNATQMYPLLIDGSIDLAFDTGGSVSFAKTGKFRIVGYSAPDSYEGLNENFGKVDKELIEIQTWLSISVPRNIDPVVKQTTIQQLKSIITSESFKLHAKESLGTATAITQPKLDRLIEKQATTIGKYWK